MKIVVTLDVARQQGPPVIKPKIVAALRERLNVIAGVYPEGAPATYYRVEVDSVKFETMKVEEL